MNRSSSYYCSTIQSVPETDAYNVRRDDQLQQRLAREWIEATLRQKLPGNDLHSCLKDGVYLCKLINHLQAGTVPQIIYSNHITAKAQNISSFLQAAARMGVRMTDLFYVTDLLDNRNMAAVTWTILSLAKLLASKDLAVEHSSKHNPWLHHNHKPCDSPKQPSPSFLTERTHRMWEQQEADVPLAQTWGSHTRHFTSPSHQSATYDFCTANTIVTSPSHNTSPFTKKQSRSVSLPLLSSDNDYQGFHGTGDWTIGEHFNEKETLLKEESLAGNAASNHPSMHLESVPTSFLSNDLYPPQPRYSIVSLPDEDDLLWEGDDLDAAVPQRTLPLGALSLERLSSQLTCDSTNIHLKSLSIEEEEISPRSNTSSGDSGYGTTRKHQQEPSSSMPLHLASLFDYRVNDQWENDHPHDVSGDMTGSHVEVSQRDRASNTYSYQEDHTHPTKTTSPASTTSASSRISKLAQLSFTKKLSMRHKMPFHMRYQEWTDQKVKREQQTSMQRQLSAGDISLIMQQPEEGDHIFDHVDYSKPSTIGFGHSAQYRLQSKTNNDTRQTPQHIPSVKHTTEEVSNSMKANVSQEPSIPTQCSVRLTSADPVHSYPRKQAHQINYSVSHAPSIHISNAANGLEVPLPRRKSTGTLMSDAMKPVLNTSDQESIDMLDDAGMIIARYKLGNTIGKGHFGTVYRALELCTGRMVAVKRIKLDDARKEDIDDVLQEAELLQSLMHPNIVKYEGFIQSAEHINIVLEFVENGSLLNTLKHFGSFPENLVANYCLRILEGLNYLHERDVVHCDLKAANILTTKTGDVKLSDFGVSLNLKLKEANAGAVAGTPNWMPPEVIELKGASTKSDIWSLGCTVIELCTGKPPYANLIPMTALFRIVEDDCPPLPEDVSDELLDFLKLCFRKCPEDRPTAVELLKHPWIVKYESAALRRLSDIGMRASAGSFPRSLRHISPASLKDVEPWTSRSTPHKKPSRSSLPVTELLDSFKLPVQAKSGYSDHRFVKGSFPKGAVRCKACQLPIKKDALVCEDCGHICHSKCKSNSVCHQNIHGGTLDKSFFSKSTSDLPKSKMSSMMKTDMEGSTTRSLQRSSYHHDDADKANFPRPTSSVSSQLRQRTRKLSRVFTSVVHQPTSTTYPLNKNRSTETLQDIQESEVFLPPLSSGTRDERQRKTKRDKGKPSSPDECIIS